MRGLLGLVSYIYLYHKKAYKISKTKVTVIKKVLFTTFQEKQSPIGTKIQLTDSVNI